MNPLLEPKLLIKQIQYYNRKDADPLIFSSSGILRSDPKFQEFIWTHVRPFAGYANIRKVEVQLIRWCTSNFGERGKLWCLYRYDVHLDFGFVHKKDAALFKFFWMV